ncbi:MAG: hypothetical protein HY821_12430 [Acidobacteria bacterium]|nr:hypothetical protein [Acidobacteriota bacterium]
MALARLIDAQNRLERANRDRSKPAAKGKKPEKTQERAQSEAVFPMAEILDEPLRAVAVMQVLDGSKSTQPHDLDTEYPSIEFPLTHGRFKAGSILPLPAPAPVSSALRMQQHAIAPACERAVVAMTLPSQGKLSGQGVKVECGAGTPLPLHAISVPAHQAQPAAMRPEFAADAALPAGRLRLLRRAGFRGCGLIREAGGRALRLGVAPQAGRAAWAAVGRQPGTPASRLRTEWHPPAAVKEAELPAYCQCVPLELVAQASARQSRAVEAPLWATPEVHLSAARVPEISAGFHGLRAAAETPPEELPAGIDSREKPAGAAGRYAVEAQFAPAPPAAAPRMPAVQSEAGSLKESNRTARIKVKAMAAAAGAAPGPAVHAAVPQFEPERTLLVPVAGALTDVSMAAPGLATGELPPVPAGITNARRPELDWLGSVINSAQQSAYPSSGFRPQPPDPALPQETEPDVEEPPMQRLLPVMPPRPLSGEPGQTRWSGPVMALKEIPSPQIPACHLTTDQADGSGPRSTRAPEKPAPGGNRLSLRLKELPGSRFWMHAPADLKWVALGLPLLVVLVVSSFRPTQPKVEKPATAEKGASYSAIGNELSTVQQVLLRRAAVKLYDDFRGGLGSWSGVDGWSKTWKYGQAGFLEPGQLAIYTPTVRMRNYTLQFLGQIEKRSLNWVFRAANPSNYYSMRIVIQKTGPLPEAALIRSTVIDGKETGVKSLPIPFSVQPDTMYLVRMNVNGADFTTYIQDQVVDTFHDERLVQGGVGFFGARGDTGRLRWVEVTHQYDFLGRLCAMLAPYDVTTQGAKGD